MKMYDLSQWFLHKEPMTIRKVQKLCYYAVAWGYVLLEKAIVDDPQFEAWVYGAASPTLYNHYKKYGFANIPKSHTAPKFERDVTIILKETWGVYGGKDSDWLEKLSRSEPPWAKTRGDLPQWEPSHKKISRKLMTAYYKSLL